MSHQRLLTAILGVVRALLVIAILTYALIRFGHAAGPRQDAPAAPTVPAYAPATSSGP